MIGMLNMIFHNPRLDYLKQGVLLVFDYKKKKKKKKCKQIRKRIQIEKIEFKYFQKMTRNRILNFLNPLSVKVELRRTFDIFVLLQKDIIIDSTY